MRICYTIFCTFVCVQNCPQQKVKMNNQISINNPNLLNSILFTVVASEFLCELTGVGGGRGGGGKRATVWWTGRKRSLKNLYEIRLHKRTIFLLR